jgi:hypothetical protein
LVILSNWAVNHLKFGFSGHEQPDHPSDALLQRLNLSPAYIDQILESISAELQLTNEFCSMLDSDS